MNLSLDDITARLAEGQPFLASCSDAVYAAVPAQRHSALKRYQLTPAHYRQGLVYQTTRDLELGIAVHYRVFYGAKSFEQAYVSAIKFGRTKADKEAAAAWREGNRGRTVLSPDDYREVVAIADSVQRHAGKYFSGGVAEFSAFAPCPETGIWRKAKADYWHPQHRIIVDLKTTRRNATATDFTKAVIEYGYHVQAAYYTDTFADVIGERPRAFLFVVVEKSPPYGVAVINLDDAWIQIGRKKYQTWLKTHHDCVASNNWPCYASGIQVCSPPQWLLSRELAD